MRVPAPIATVAVAVLLVAAGGAPDRASAQLPVHSVGAPPPEHRADPSLTTYSFRVGPFSIGGYQTFRRTDIVTPPPVAGSIVGMDARIVDPTGVEIPQAELMLHHNVFTNGGPDNTRGDGACPHRSVRERFYGTSEELRPLTLPRGYGYPTAPDDNWKMIWMAMNHRHERREAYVEYRVTVDPAALTPVTPYWLSVVPCVPDPQYTVPGGQPRGSRHVRSKTIAMPQAGRIVAVGGHLHGGSHELRLTQPACENRTIAVNDPTYASRRDPIYGVRPLLHEPDPKSISWTQWDDGGWAIGAGERLRVSAVYDGRRPHMRVMGIAHVYLAADSSVPRTCAPAPARAETLGPSFSGRDDPPAVRLTLAQWRGRGRAKEIARPAGAFSRRDGSARVLVDDFAFDPPLLSIPRGATLRWSFRDQFIHDATVVRGPRGFATATVKGRDQRHRFTVPGEYRLYCSIHPTQMSQVVKVR